MATNLRMYYNPYLCKVNMRVLNENGIEEFMDGSVRDRIEKNYEERFCLEDDGEKLLDIILEAYRGSHICIDFVGTSENYKLMDKLCSARDIDVSKSEKQRIFSVEEINKKITDKVKQLKEFGYDIDCNGEIDRILDATIPVVVVGNMSAGKSSFINALIGEELLPSGQNRTTGVNCALHNSPSSIRVEFSVSSKNVCIDCADIDVEFIKTNISEELADIIACEVQPIRRVRKIIDFYNYKDPDNKIDRTILLDNKLLDVYCPFYNSDIPEQVVFYDTPGSGSDSFGDDLLTLKKALEDQTKGFIVFVCGSRKELDKSRSLIDVVQEATGNKLDLPHTVVICNQTEEEPDCTVQTSTEEEWANRIIYVTSAVALGARKNNTNIDCWAEDRIRKVFNKNIDAFSDPENEDYTSLPQYCSLPDSRKKGYKEEHEKLVKELHVALDRENSRKSLLQFNSGILTAEREIIYVARELFPYNQCERARTVFLKLLAEYKENIEKMEWGKEEQRKKRVKEFDDIYKPLCDELSGFTEGYIPVAQSEFAKVLDAANYRISEDKSGAFVTKVKEKFLGQDSYSVHSEEYIKDEISRQLDEELTNFLKLAESDFNTFLSERVFEEYPRQCKEVIYKQASLSAREKEVFGDFFTQKKLSDQTKESRKNTIKEINLDLPQLSKKISGEKWYSSAWKSITNTGKSVAYWAKKNFGGISNELRLFYETVYTDFSDKIDRQTKEYIEEILKKIMNSFSDDSSDNNIICELNPQLGDIKRTVQKLISEIGELEDKKKRIEGELTELNRIYSSTNR